MSDSSEAVFLSYASQDAEAARRIADALRAFGVEVWFDQSELRGGEAWDAKIRRQIHECALFLPVISATTQARGEGYFRREWKLAVERMNDMAEGVPFLVPVVVDDITEAAAIVPDAFRSVQWTRLPHGVPAPQFVEQVRKLLEAPRSPAVQRTEVRGQKSEVRVSQRRKPLARWAWGTLAAVLVGAGAGTFFALRRPAATNPPPETPAAAATDKSIAVLPFQNFSENKEANDVFVNGIHDEIITRLALIGDLRVVSRQSVVEYQRKAKTMRQVGQDLGVAYVLEGSVQRVGNRVRVIGQLIRAATDEHVWTAKPYDKDITDIFAIQSELAQDIAASLHAALTPQEKALLDRRLTDNPAAYDLYLKARESYRQEGFGPAALQRQETLFQSAVTLDPDFAAAWAALAGVHGGTYFLNWDHTEERKNKYKAAVDTAVRLAPDAPETIRALASYRSVVLNDPEQSIQLYERLAQLQPNNAEIQSVLGELRGGVQGRWAESADYHRRSTRLDPGCWLYAMYLQSRLRECRRYDDAIEEQRRLVSLRPDSAGDRYYLALLPFLARGSTKEMDEWLAGLPPTKANSPGTVEIRKTWARARGDFAEAIRLDRLQPYSRDDLNLFAKEQQAFDGAVTLAASGDVAGARARLEDLPEKTRAQLVNDPDNANLLSSLGRMEALLGHNVEAVRCARRAVELVPPSYHRYWHAVHAYQLAVTLAWAGDKDGAIEEFARLMRSELTVPGMSVFHLKSGPWAWPLRDDPRFQALLADPRSNAPLY